MTALAADARGAVSHGMRRVQRVLLGWWLVALAAFVALPWYFPQDLSMSAALLRAFGGAATASVGGECRHGKAISAAAS